MNQQPSSTLLMTETLVPTIVVAWAVVVGADTNHDGVACVQFDGNVVAPRSGHTGNVVPLWHAAQPGQGWIIVGGHAALVVELESLGVVGYVVDSAADVLPTLLQHANTLRLAAQANSVEMMAEVTVLRRELNSALSAPMLVAPVNVQQHSFSLDFGVSNKKSLNRTTGLADEVPMGHYLIWKENV